MAPDDAVEKVATLAGYPLADIVHAGDQLRAATWLGKLAQSNH